MKTCSSEDIFELRRIRVRTYSSEDVFERRRAQASERFECLDLVVLCCSSLLLFPCAQVSDCLSVLVRWVSECFGVRVPWCSSV